MNMISLIFKKVYFVHCCIYIYIQSLLYFYLAQEHLFIIFYEYPAKLFFRTNFDEKFQTEPHCGASSGTAEGVGQWRHDSTNFWLIYQPYSNCGGGADYARQIGLSPLLLETFRRPCSLEAKSG